MSRSSQSSQSSQSQTEPTRKRSYFPFLLVGLIALLVGGFALTAGAAGPFGEGGFFASHLGGHFGGHGGGHGHRAAHAHHAIAHLIDDLDLDASQQLHIDAIHETLMSRHQEMASGHDEHLSALIERIETGELDVDEARQVVDAHLTVAQHTAYTVLDELVPLVNSLDDTQRELLVDHLEQVQTLHEHLQELRH